MYLQPKAEPGKAQHIKQFVKDVVNKPRETVQSWGKEEKEQSAEE